MKWRWRGWIALRIAIIAYGVFACLRATPPPSEVPLPGWDLWYVAPLAILAAPVMLALVIGVQAFNPASAEIWEWPSWDQFPLWPGQPIVAFHFLSHVSLAISLATLVASAWAPERTFFAVVAVCFAIGMRLGIWVVPVLFPGKMRRAESETESEP